MNYIAPEYSAWKKKKKNQNFESIAQAAGRWG